MENKIMNIKELAEYLKVSEPTIRRHYLQQGIPHQKIGNQFRFLKTAVDEWLVGQRKDL